MFNFDYEARHHCSIEAGVGALIGGGLSAGSSIIGGSMQASAARDAAQIQAAAADRATQLQAEMYQQNRADFSPYRDIGAVTLDTLSQMYGGPFGGYTGEGFSIPAHGGTGISSDWWTTRGGLTTQLMQPYMKGSLDIMNYYAPGGEGMPLSMEEIGRGFKGDPSYAFARDENMRAMSQALAGRGGGGAIQAMGDRASGIATQNYNNYFNNYMNQYGKQLAASTLGLDASRVGGGQQLETQKAEGDLFNQYFNRLASMARIGQTSTSSTGTLGQQAAANAGAGTIASGQATAGGITASANALNQGFQGATAGINSMLQNPALYNQSSTTPEGYLSGAEASFGGGGDLGMAPFYG